MEVACPVFDREIRRKLIRDLNLMLSDNVKARKMLSDGTYRKKTRGAEPVSAQAAFMKEALNARRPAAVYRPQKRTLLGRLKALFRRKNGK